MWKFLLNKYNFDASNNVISGNGTQSETLTSQSPKLD